MLSQHSVPDEVRSRFHEVFATDVIPRGKAEDMKVKCRGCGREINLAEAFPDVWKRLLEWSQATDHEGHVYDHRAARDGEAEGVESGRTCY